MVATDVVSREHELATVARLFDQRRAGPRAVIIEGNAGIGKTTLWEAALDLARDRSWRVLAARPAEAEIRFSYVAVRDLLGPLIDETIHGLPGPQRRAVETAFLRAEDAGILTRADGGLEFTHPLLASVVYSQVPPARRRRLHRAVAAALAGSGTDGGASARARAWHLGLGAEGPDAGIAEVLDAAAAAARSAAAPEGAARLAELARKLTQPAGTATASAAPSTWPSTCSRRGHHRRPLGTGSARGRDGPRTGPRAGAPVPGRRAVLAAKPACRRGLRQAGR